MSPATGPFQRTVMKWVGLHMPLPWPPGVPTRPEIEQGKGGTRPMDWDLDVARLCGWISEFAELRTFAAHPIFGPLGLEECMIWGYRHVDHHLRQFGV